MDCGYVSCFLLIARPGPHQSIKQTIQSIPSFNFDPTRTKSLYSLKFFDLFSLCLLHFSQIQSSDAFRSPMSFQRTAITTTATNTAQTNSTTSKSTDSGSDSTTLVPAANKSKSALHVVRNIGKPPQNTSQNTPSH